MERFRLDYEKPKLVPISGGDSLITLCQKKIDIAEDDNHDMEEFPYRELIGSLLYLGLCTRPDISYDVSQLARFVTRMLECRWEELKGVMKYVKGTID